MINAIIERDELRQRDHTSPELQRLNEEITRTTSAHKQAKWKQFVETMDHKTLFQAVENDYGN